VSEVFEQLTTHKAVPGAQVVVAWIKAKGPTSILSQERRQRRIWNKIMSAVDVEIFSERINISGAALPQGVGPSGPRAKDMEY
jgi:hypothetical protein